MTRGERLFMFLFGISILLGLYFDQAGILYVIVAVSLFEGLTNLRSSRIFSNAMGENVPPPVNPHARFGFEASRAWRLAIGTAVLFSGVIFYQQLWFLAWFIGFAVAGAGLSGVCPVLILLQRLGFR